MSSFTPGPWKVQEDSYGYWGVYDKAGNCLAEAPEPEDKANIHIMALAPEMYEALKEVAPYVSICDYEMEGADGGKAEELFNVINALLRRIEGEEATE